MRPESTDGQDDVLHSMTEQHYRMAWEHAPIGMALAAVEDGRWLYTNEAMCRLTGYSPAELAQMSFHTLTHPDDLPDTLHQLDELLAGAPYVQITKRYLRKDGSVMRARRTGSLVRGADGRPQYLIVQVQDITHEHEVESLLAEAVRQFRLLFDTMADGVVAMDANGRIRLANPAAARIMQMRQDELGKADVFDRKWQFMRTDGSPLPLEELPAMVAQRERREVRDCIVGIRNLEDGKERWINVTSVPQFRGQDPAPYQVLTTFSDVTHIREAERALRAHEERFRVLVENASELVFILESDDTFKFASESFPRILGYTPAELIGTNALALVHQDDREHARAIVQHAIAHPHELVPFQLRAIHKSGSWRMFEAVVRSMLDHPAVEGIVVNARDITDRWLAEQALQQREAELRQAQKMEAIGRLAGGIAHDFNNVLTAISGHAEFLAEMFPPGEPAHADIDGIRTAADRAARLTAQLLAFSRTQLMQPVVLDLREIVLGMRQMLQRLLGEDIMLQTETEDRPVLVHADRTQLEQVLLNLAVNARDAMEDGGTLTLRASVAALSELTVSRDTVIPSASYAVLAVEDTGAGIPSEIAEKIFEPFFTTKSRSQGSGLGLSTVYGIVKQSGGFVFFHSEPGQGTRFHVLLPLYTAPADIMPRVSESTHDVAAEPRTVLLVEDESNVRNMAERVLLRQGYQVVTAANGVEALRVMEQRQGAIDVVVTDVVMPEMSGPALATELARLYPDTAIVFMSGYTDNEIDSEGIRAAEATFLPKPFTPQELAQRVKAVMRKPQIG